MSDPTPPPGPGPDPGVPGDQTPEPRSHRAPTRPRRIIVPAVVAVAAVLALLVAFNRCSGSFEGTGGPINGSPGVTPGVTATTPTATETVTPTPTPTPSKTKAPTPTPTASKTPTPSPKPTASRIPVAVLNGTTVPGLAAKYAALVRSKGWTISGVGNWKGSAVTTNTVFYGPGDKARAQRLAAEVGGSPAVRPALAGMSTSTLTFVVVQQIG